MSLRTARVEDAPQLAVLWAESLRRAEHDDQVADLEAILTASRHRPEEQVVVALLDGEVAGAVVLRATTVSPLNPERTVQALSLKVFEQHRRRGVGRALVDAATQFAEEAGITHLTTTARSNSRDTNRFLARLAFGPQVTVRTAATAVVRSRLEARHPTPTTTAGSAQGDRQVTRVLAARRSMRRARHASTEGRA